MVTANNATNHPTSLSTVEKHINQLLLENKEITASIGPLQAITHSLKRKLEEVDKRIPDADAKRAKVFAEKVKLQQELSKIEDEKTKLDKLRAGLEEEKFRLDREKVKLDEDQRQKGDAVTGWTKLRDETVSFEMGMRSEILTRGIACSS
jgi:chromosome segregation ATPase